MIRVVLPSNNGSSRIELQFGGRLDFQGSPGLEADVSVHGKNWAHDDEADLSARIQSSCISLEALISLSRDLDRWLGLDLEDLDPDKLSQTYELAFPRNNSLKLVFGQRSDTVSGLNPVVTFEYASGAFEGQFHFATDQSGLREFNDSLRGVLRDAA
ncbi:MAG: hypothetical protein AB8G16_00115 [Gammaproteobacteria bacterium]